MFVSLTLTPVLSLVALCGSYGSVVCGIGAAGNARRVHACSIGDFFRHLPEQLRKQRALRPR